MSMKTKKLARVIAKIKKEKLADEVVLGYIENIDSSKGFIIAKFYKESGKSFLIVNENASFDQMNSVVQFFYEHESKKEKNNIQISKKSLNTITKRESFGFSKPTSANVSLLGV